MGKRGDLLNLADLLKRITEQIILWIYAKNKKFQPYTSKWLFYHLENRLVPESKYIYIIKKPYIEPIKTLKQAHSIKDELIVLCKKIGIKFKYKDINDVFQHHSINWKNASKTTKYYLSW